jgi:hypothetical protein
MKKITITLLAALIVVISSAQEISRQSIQDSVIGWMKVYHFKGVKEPMKVDAKTYSAAQLSIVILWQTGYRPVMCLKADWAM